jgi:hypothetical protein
MADVVNLRTARKRAERDKAALDAAGQRLIHGASKQDRSKAKAESAKTSRTLDQHRIETGDRR